MTLEFWICVAKIVGGVVGLLLAGAIVLYIRERGGGWRGRG